MNSSTSNCRYVTREMRWVLLAASGLVFAIGAALFVLAGSTARYFAWTVNPPITAAFMGAGFLAAGVLELTSARARVWANARVGVGAVLAFTIIMLGVTLYHLDRFHTSEPQTWLWIAVYVAFPPLMLFALIRQLMAPGADLARTAPLPSPMRVIIAIQAAVMLVVGVALLAVPLTIAPHWPWQLSALTGRAIGAWLIGFGLAAAQAAIENDFERVRNVAISSVIFPVLIFIALVRFQDQISWDMSTSWMFVFFLASMVLVGLATLASSRSLTRVGQPA